MMDFFLSVFFACLSALAIAATALGVVLIVGTIKSIRE